MSATTDLARAFRVSSLGFVAVLTTAVCVVPQSSPAEAATPRAALVQQSARPSARLHVSTADVTLGRFLSVNARGSASAEGVRSVVFRFGDGSHVLRRSLPASARHRYRHSGDYRVTLIITDRRGRSDRASAAVTVAKTHRATGALPVTHTVTSSPLAGASALPPAIDLSGSAVPSGNQGQHSSCVAWAIGYHMMGWYMNRAGRSGPPFAPMVREHPTSTMERTPGAMQETH